MQDKHGNAPSVQNIQAKSIDKKVHTLEDMIANWAKTKAAQVGTTLEWVDVEYENERTNRLKKGHKKYREEEKFKAILGKPKYINSLTKEEEKRLISQEQKKCENKSSVDESNEIFTGSRINKRHTFSLNCGLKLSASIKGGIGVIEAQAGIEIDVGLTKEVSKEIEEQGHISKKVTVKAHHEALFLMEVWVVPTESEFKLPIELQGKVPVLFKDKVTYDKGKLVKDKAAKHQLVFVPVTDIFKDLLEQKQLPNELEIKVENGQVLCILTGTYIVEEQRVNVVSEEQKPLTTSASKPEETKKDNQTKDEKRLSDATLLAQQGTFTVINRQVGVDMPTSLAEGIFAETIKEKVMQGKSENPNIKLLLEKLGQPAYASSKDFLEKQIAKMIEGIANPDAKEYLAWFAQHYGKDSNFTMKAYFDSSNIDVFIREKKQHDAEIVEYVGTTEVKEDAQKSTVNNKNM